MRVSTALMIAGVAVIFLSACSSAPQAAVGGLPPTGVSGIRASLINPVADGGKAAAILRKLYITDYATNAVELLRYGTWTSLGQITTGGSPQGDWVDNLGNLYVSNLPPSVTEYDPSGNLIFTYSANMSGPSAVTTDRAGNVYVADGIRVNEYAQESNAVAATCSLAAGEPATGVAVNKRGSVFVTFHSEPRGPGGLMVYPNGLNAYGCGGVLLPVSLDQPNGMAIDRQGNLVVCDAGNGAVDIIANPYNSVTGTLSFGWVGPNSVTIDRAGTQAYVTEPTLGDVEVVTYPAGSNVATLGSANGLMDPASAVDSRNYVP